MLLAGDGYYRSLQHLGRTFASLATSKAGPSECKRALPQANSIGRPVLRRSWWRFGRRDCRARSGRRRHGHRHGPARREHYGRGNFDPGQARSGGSSSWPSLELARLAIPGDACTPDLLSNFNSAAAKAQSMRSQVLPLNGAPKTSFVPSAVQDESADALLSLEVPRASQLRRADHRVDGEPAAHDVRHGSGTIRTDARRWNEPRGCSAGPDRPIVRQCVAGLQPAEQPQDHAVPSMRLALE